MNTATRHIYSRILPGLTHVQAKYRQLLDSYVGSETDWLDVGCGRQLFAEWLPHSVESQRSLVARAGSVVGVDAADGRPHVSIPVKYLAPADKLPFRDASFSLVTANMVVEHFSDPLPCLREIHRVLRPGGLFVFHTPNRDSPPVFAARLVPSAIMLKLASLIDGRTEDDIFPTFYRLNRITDIVAAARKIGFSVLCCDPVESFPILDRLGWPISLGEALCIRLCRSRWLARFRIDLQVVLQKPAGISPS